MRAVADFTIDFQSLRYDHDSELAAAILSELVGNLSMKENDSFIISETRTYAAGSLATKTKRVSCVTLVLKGQPDIRA